MGQILEVLLVEDNPGDAELARDQLSGQDEQLLGVTHVQRLDAALALVSERKFDVVVLDLGLPDSSGLETLLSLIQTGPKVAIVVMSGSRDDLLRKEALSAGALDFLRKDESRDKLLGRSVAYACARFTADVQRRQLEELVEANPDAQVVMDEKGRVLHANGAALDLFGGTLESFRGKSVSFPIEPPGSEVEIARERHTGRRRAGCAGHLGRATKPFGVDSGYHPGSHHGGRPASGSETRGCGQIGERGGTRF